jgi:hypothetical protein
MSQLPDDFCIFILSHGRPDNIWTLKTLKKGNYTGKLYIVIDNEDKTAERYYENFGRDKVIMFDKKAEADDCDEGNNFDERRTITHARNATFKIAKQLGIKYFMHLDDDFKQMAYKVIDKGIAKQKPIKDLNRLFANLLDYYKSIDAASIAIAQGGDYFGFSSTSNRPYTFSKRKCMNSFICSVDRPFKFIGAMNEDVNTYTTLGSRGVLFLTIPNAGLWQAPTQSQSGGITDMYKRFGTYAKAFTTVMMQPSSVKISLVGSAHHRLHHKITWKLTVPQILREKHKKRKEE